MSSSACQGLQTCLEEPRVLQVKLTRPVSEGGLSFLQCLSSSGNAETETVYVHPLSKSKLSAASLAMCTESLGSESGAGDAGGDMSPPEITRRPQPRPSKKQSRAFPPPLTSTRVRPLREDGRLILTVSPATTNLQAHRTNGRLTIRLLTQNSHDQENRDSDGDEEEECEEMEYSEGYNGNDGESMRGKIGNESLGRARMSRCKECGNGNNNWDTHFAWLLKPICLP